MRNDIVIVFYSDPIGVITTIEYEWCLLANLTRFLKKIALTMTLSTNAIKSCTMAIREFVQKQAPINQELALLF